jgi:hypothetical protein
MLRRLHLILAALAMLVAPLAMQSGMAMAAMPMDHSEMAQTGHCGEEDDGSDDKSGAMTQCCIAMCSAVAPLGTALLEPVAYHAPIVARFHTTEHSPFLAELPTPPPKLA